MEDSTRKIAYKLWVIFVYYPNCFWRFRRSTDKLLWWRCFFRLPRPQCRKCKVKLKAQEPYAIVDYCLCAVQPMFERVVHRVKEAQNHE